MKYLVPIIMKQSTKKITQFAKWLRQEGKKNWGPHCKEYVLGCSVCRFYRILEEVEALSEDYKSLDKI